MGNFVFRAATAAVALSALLSTGPALAQNAALTAEESVAVATKSLTALQEAGGVSEGAAAAVKDPTLASDARDGSLDLGAAAMSLPVKENAAATRVGNAVVVEGEVAGTKIVAQSLLTGVRAMVTIGDASAPERYEFAIEGVSRLEVMPDGSVLGFALDTPLDATAERASLRFAPPWAKDANGNDFPTHYEVEGTTLVQVVEHQAAKGLAYPLTADPTVTERVNEYKKLWEDWKAYRKALEGDVATGVVWREYWLNQWKSGPVRSRSLARTKYIAWRDYANEKNAKIPGAKHAEGVYRDAYDDWNRYLEQLKAFHFSVDWGSGWTSTTAKVKLGLAETRFVAGLPASAITKFVVKKFLGKGVVPAVIAYGAGLLSAQTAREVIATTTGVGDYRCVTIHLTYKHPWTQVADFLSSADFSAINVKAGTWLCR